MTCCDQSQRELCQFLNNTVSYTVIIRTLFVELLSQQGLTDQASVCFIFSSIFCTKMVACGLPAASAASSGRRNWTGWSPLNLGNQYHPVNWDRYGKTHLKKNAVCTSFSLGKPMDFHSYVYLPVVIRCFSSQCSLHDSIFRFIVLTCFDSKQQNSHCHSQLHGDFFFGCPGHSRAYHQHSVASSMYQTPQFCLKRCEVVLPHLRGDLFPCGSQEVTSTWNFNQRECPSTNCM